MTAKAAICKALLLGKTLNIRNGFNSFGVTNIPREISQIRRSFSINIEKLPRTGVTRFGILCQWTDYRLKLTAENSPGVKKMIEYVVRKEGEPKTNEQVTSREQLNKILSYITQTFENGPTKVD